MPTPPLSDEQLQESVSAFKAHGNKTAAAAALGIPYTTFKSRLKNAAQRGLMGFAPVLPGYEVSKISTDHNGEVRSVTQKPEHGPVFEMPATHVLGKITVNRDAEGRIIQDWVRVHPNADAALALIEHIKEQFKDFEPCAKPVPAPDWTDEKFLNLYPMNDWHINMLAWKNETGQNWNLRLAEEKIGDTTEIVIKRSRRAKIGIVLGGGDTMHNDDNTNRTAKSHNLLDCDGRHSKGLRVAERLKVRLIDCALQHNDLVIVRELKGNHDENSSVTIAHFLSAYYRNDPRVIVDLDDSLFWYYEFGRVMLAATHGHTVKLNQLPTIMAHRQAEMWGRTKFRYGHGFHVHHKDKIATEGNGVICETHQAPIPQDGWHFGSGFLSGRSVKAITYHREFGYFGEVSEPILDAC